MKLLDRLSIYTATTLIIVVSVTLIMLIFSSINFYDKKQQIHQEMASNANKIISSIEGPVSDFIAAYSVEDYNKLLKSEIEHYELLAITVSDFNMAKLTGKAQFIQGYLLNPKGQIVEIDSNSALHSIWLESAYFTLQKTLTDPHGKNLGTLDIYISDSLIQNKINDLIQHSVVSIIGLSVSLVIILLLALKLQILNPIAKITKQLTNRNAVGIPNQHLRTSGPKELSMLAQTLNDMIDAIETSSQTLTLKKQALEDERNRFKLAIEGTQEGIWDWEISTNKVYHSEQFAHILGYASDELEYENFQWFELICEQDRAKTYKRFQKYLATPSDHPFNATFRIESKSGLLIWINFRGKALFDPEGFAVRFVGFISDVSQSVLQKQQIDENQLKMQYQAQHDHLTHLLNRDAFIKNLQIAIDQAKIKHNKVSVLFIDLDYFKEINDSLGHSVGDEVLKIVAHRLQSLVPDETSIARFGGDEFTLLVQTQHDHLGSAELCGKIIQEIQRPFQFDGFPLCQDSCRLVF